MMWRSQAFWRGLILFVAVMGAALSIVVGFFYRTYKADITARKLCEVIYQIVEESDQRLDGISYYRDHPDELATAHANNQRILDKLDCETNPPVKTEEDQ